MIGKYDSDFDDSSSADDERKASSSGEFEWEEMGKKGLERKGQEQTEQKPNSFEEENVKEEAESAGGMESNEGHIQSDKEEEVELSICEDSLVRTSRSLLFPLVNLLV